MVSVSREGGLVSLAGDRGFSLLDLKVTYQVLGRSDGVWAGVQVVLSLGPTGSVDGGDGTWTA